MQRWLGGLMGVWCAGGACFRPLVGDKGGLVRVRRVRASGERESQIYPTELSVRVQAFSL